MKRLKINNPFAGFWGRITPRERNLILILVLVAFVMGTVVLLFLRTTKLDERRDEIADMERAKELLYTQGAVYQERLREKERRESRISTQPVLFSTLLEEASTVADGIEVTNQEEQPPVDLGGGLRKRVVEFDLRSVSLEALTKFLAAVEQQKGHVILTNRLLVRSPSSNEDRLNVEVAVATWERAATEEEQEEEQEQ